MSEFDNNDEEKNDFNNSYKYGFDMVTSAILGNSKDCHNSIQGSLELAMEYMGASSVVLYRRDRKTNLFNRFSASAISPKSKYLGISDSCLVNYLNRNDGCFNEVGLDINYVNKKTHIDIMPFETLGNYNNIIIVANNDLTKPQEFNSIMIRGLKSILTNMELMEQLQEEKEQLKYEKIQLEHDKLIDSLTGIKNRAGYYYRITELFKNGRPQHLVFTITDLLKLKSVNDEINHAAGDHYIKSCAEALHMYFHRADGNHIYRIGGDEFVILSEQFDKDTVESNIKKASTVLRNSMHQYAPNQIHLDYMINYGSAEICDGIDTPEALYKSADNELSNHKKRVYGEAGYDRRR